MLAVVWCESNWRADVVGHEVYNGRDLYFVGWWQVLGGPADPAENTAAAYAQWEQWQAGKRRNPWPNCG